MKNPFQHIVPLLFTEYSLPVRLPMLLPVRFLPVGKGKERREEKRREEKRRDQTWLLGEMLKQGEARHDSCYHYCSITQSDFTNSFFLSL